MKIISKIKSIFLSETGLLIRELKKLSKRDLIIAQHELNRWNYPEKLIHLKPKWWDTDIENDRKHFYFNRPVMDYLYSVTQARERSHYHVVEYLGRTEEYFNNFWESSRQNPNRAKTNPMDEVMDKVLLECFKDKNTATKKEMSEVILEIQLKTENRLN